MKTLILAFALAVCWASPTVAFAPMTPIGAARLRATTGSMMLRTPLTVTSGTVTLQFANKKQQEPTFRERLADFDADNYQKFRSLFRIDNDNAWVRVAMYFVCVFLGLYLTAIIMALYEQRTKLLVYYVIWLIQSWLPVQVSNIKWDKELDKEYDYTRRLQNSNGLKLPPPSNGTYVARKDESNDKHVIKLTFQDDGSVSGFGEEFTVIDGVWTKSKVRWTEQHNKSSAIIRGKRLPDESIQIFHPSYRGTYTLQPGWFDWLFKIMG